MSSTCTPRLAAARATLLLLAGLALGAAPARAADLPPPPLRGPLPPPEPLPEADWTGASVSVLAGQAWTGDQSLRTLGANPKEQAVVEAGHLGRVDFDTRGLAVGGGVGYDWQMRTGYEYGAGLGSGLVVGAMADLLYTDLDRSRHAGFEAFDYGFSVDAHQRLDFLGTARGRLGYAFGPVLVYGTGGFAYGSVAYSAHTDVTDPCGCTGPLDAGKHRGMEIGTAWGGGIEVMATRMGLPLMPSWANLSVKVEYLRYDLGTRNVAVSGIGPVFGPGGIAPAGQTSTARFRTEGEIVKAGLSYRFSGLGY